MMKTWFTVLLLIPALARAEFLPPNDEESYQQCFMAESIAVDETVTFEINGDTDDQLGAVLSCNGPNDDWYNVESFKNEWFTTQGTGSVLTASTCDANTEIEAFISIYQDECITAECASIFFGGVGCPGLCVGTAQKIDCEDGSLGTRISWPSQMGRTYYVQVWQYRDINGPIRQMAIPQLQPCGGSVALSLTESDAPSSLDQRLFSLSYQGGDMNASEEDVAITIPDEACANAIGPLPYDGSKTEGTTSSAVFYFAQVHSANTLLRGQVCRLSGSADFDVSLQVTSLEFCDRSLSSVTGSLVSPIDENGCRSISWKKAFESSSQPLLIGVHGTEEIKFSVAIQEEDDSILPANDQQPEQFRSDNVGYITLELGKNVQGSTANALSDTFDNFRGRFCDVDTNKPGVWYALTSTADEYLVVCLTSAIDSTAKLAVFGELIDIDAVFDGCVPDQIQGARDGCQNSIIWPTAAGSYYSLLVQTDEDEEFVLQLTTIERTDVEECAVATRNPPVSESDAGVPSDMPSDSPSDSPSDFPSDTPSTSPKENNPECALNNGCAVLNLTDMCCPTPEGVTLACCDSADAGVALTCKSNPTCDALELSGPCCPTTDDKYLDCCEAVPAECLMEGVLGPCWAYSAVQYKLDNELVLAASNGTSSANQKENSLLPMMMTTLLLLAVVTL